jgi:hypothetical protein
MCGAQAPPICQVPLVGLIWNAQPDTDFTKGGDKMNRNTKRLRMAVRAARFDGLEWAVLQVPRRDYDKGLDLNLKPTNVMTARRISTHFVKGGKSYVHRNYGCRVAA